MRSEYAANIALTPNRPAWQTPAPQRTRRQARRVSMLRRLVQWISR